MANSAHVHPVLLIDEAHLLSTEILSEIRLLTNFHVDSFNALTVILCGSENLTRKFGLSVTSLSATPPAQAGPRGFPVGACAPPTGLPVLLLSPSSRMPPPVPRRNRSVLSSLASRPLSAFPVLTAGRLPHCPFRGLLSVHFALRPACSLNRPQAILLHRSASVQFVTSLHRSDCFRLERHPLGHSAFPRRTSTSGATATGCAPIRIWCGLPPSSPARLAQHDCHPSVLPESVQFSIVKSEQFSIDIDRGHLLDLLPSAKASVLGVAHPSHPGARCIDGRLDDPLGGLRASRLGDTFIRSTA